MKSAHFVIEYSEPRSGETYYYNNYMDVICNSAERALELFKPLHPEARIHVIRRVGSGKELLIDPDLEETN